METVITMECRDQNGCGRKFTFTATKNFIDGGLESIRMTFDSGLILAGTNYASLIQLFIEKPIALVLKNGTWY
ncbi:MAG: hypothetical protein IPJ66_08970 [Bacteroidetes bacterium]|nr:hypothetical protein [Bacteroidota bacterium]